MAASIIQTTMTWISSRNVSGSFVVFCLCLVASVSTTALASDIAKFEIDREEDTLRVSVPSAPTAGFLISIAEEAGFNLVIEGELGEVIPQSFEGLTLEQGIRRLVDDDQVNLLFRYMRDDSGEPQLVEVRASSRVPGPPLEVILEDRKMRALNWHRPPPVIPPPPIHNMR